MSSYTPRNGTSLLTGSSDPDSDPITVRSIAGVTITAWPHVRGSLTINENGTVEYNSNDNTAHPSAGQIETYDTFSFTLWDGEKESAEYTCTVKFQGTETSTATAFDVASFDGNTYSITDRFTTPVDWEDLDAGVTFAGWVKPLTGATTSTDILRLDEAGGSRGLRLSIGGGYFRSWSPKEEYRPDMPTIGEWHHVVTMIRSAGSNDFKIVSWIDGEYWISQVWSNGTEINDQPILTFGGGPYEIADGYFLYGDEPLIQELVDWVQGNPDRRIMNYQFSAGSGIKLHLPLINETETEQILDPLGAALGGIAWTVDTDDAGWAQNTPPFSTSGGYADQAVLGFSDQTLTRFGADADIDPLSAYSIEPVGFETSGGNVAIYKDGKNNDAWRMAIPSFQGAGTEQCTVRAFFDDGTAAETSFNVTVEDSVFTTEPVSTSNSVVVPALSQDPFTEVTFTFNESSDVGSFVNGDPFVIASGANAISSTSPASKQLTPSEVSGYENDNVFNDSDKPYNWDWLVNNGRVVHGMEVDPNPYGESFDSYPSNRGGIDRYDFLPEKNLDPGYSGSPLTLEHGQIIIKAVSHEGDPNSLMGVDSYVNTITPYLRYAILTSLDSAPPANAFRPPLKGWDGKTWLTEDMIDWSRVPDIIHPDYDNDVPREHVPSPSLFWYGKGSGHAIRSAAAKYQHSGYYEAMGSQYSNNIAFVCNGNFDWETERLPVARQLVQAGWDAMWTWRKVVTGGYYNHGPFLAMAFMASVVNRGFITALADTGESWPDGDLAIDQAQRRYFYVPDIMVDRPIDDTSHTGRPAHIPYKEEHIGFPEWTLVFSTPPDSPTGNAARVQKYRAINIGAWSGSVIPFHRLDAWRTTRRYPLRDYFDRYMGWGEEAHQGRTDFGDESKWKDMYVGQSTLRAYKDLVLDSEANGGIGYTPWKGVPEHPIPPVVQWDDTAQSITVTLDNAMLPNGGFEGYGDYDPVTQRDIRYKILPHDPTVDGDMGRTRGEAQTALDAMEWTLVSDAGNALDTTFTPPETVVQGQWYQVQVRHHNVRGFGPWSTNRPLRVPAASEPLRAMGAAYYVIPLVYNEGMTADHHANAETTNPNLMTSGMDTWYVRSGWVAHDEWDDGPETFTEIDEEGNEEVIINEDYRMIDPASAQIGPSFDNGTKDQATPSNYVQSEYTLEAGVTYEFSVEIAWIDRAGLGAHLQNHIIRESDGYYLKDDDGATEQSSDRMNTDPLEGGETNLSRIKPMIFEAGLADGQDPSSAGKPVRVYVRLTPPQAGNHKFRLWKDEGDISFGIQNPELRVVS